MKIMITGVGGQGTLLASRVIGQAAMAAGLDVKVSEVHGMAQRGGNVVTYVCYGDSVASPVIFKGSADVILAFELLEGYRALPFLKKNGTMILNTQKITPMSILTKMESYPAEIIEKIEEKGVNLIKTDALKTALEFGNQQTVNIILVGILAKTSDIKKEVWLEALKAVIPAKHYELNEKAFLEAYNE